MPVMAVLFCGLINTQSVFAKTKIENLYDYVYTLQSVKPNVLTKMVVLREGKKIDLDILPVLKE